MSNSIKFTQQGGVKIVTKLLYVNTTNELQRAIPLLQDDPDYITPAPLPRRQSSALRNKRGENQDVEKGDVELEEKRHNPEEEIAMLRPRTAVVRVEVHDTGVGLRKRDLQEWVPIPLPLM